MTHLLDTNICSAHMRHPAGLAHNLMLVTHNTADFQNIPSLRLDDWLTP
ncbi:MAG: hypothetical protein J5I93_24765 [Pirellulaceae bacterium]|nr:hypothetical protein [Pirellulaceae bacterium]